MGLNKTKFFLCTELIFNKDGQIIFKKRFLSAYTLYFYRSILRGS
jgi:hypothetical protein